MDRRSFLALLGVAAAIPVVPIKGKRRIDVDGVEAVVRDVVADPSPVIPSGDVWFKVDGLDLSSHVTEVSVEQDVTMFDVTGFGDPVAEHIPGPAVVTISVELLGVEEWTLSMDKKLHVELGHRKTNYKWECMAFLKSYSKTMVCGDLTRGSLVLVAGGAA